MKLKVGLTSDIVTNAFSLRRIIHHRDKKRDKNENIPINTKITYIFRIYLRITHTQLFDKERFKNVYMSFIDHTWVINIRVLNTFVSEPPFAVKNNILHQLVPLLNSRDMFVISDKLLHGYSFFSIPNVDSKGGINYGEHYSEYFSLFSFERKKPIFKHVKH